MRGSRSRYLPHLLLFAGAVAVGLLILRSTTATPRDDATSGSGPLPDAAVARETDAATAPTGTGLARPRVDELAGMAVDSDDPATVLAAVRTLGSDHSPEARMMLATLATSHASRDVRLGAVESLRRLASERLADASDLRLTLRNLTAGGDSEIAELGQDIAAELDLAAATTHPSSATTRSHDQ